MLGNSAGSGTSAVSSGSGHIAQSLESALKTAIEVTQLVDTLEQRLGPVLHPTPPATQANQPPTGVPPASQVDVAARVQTVTGTLTAAIAGLKALHSRLDL